MTKPVVGVFKLLLSSKLVVLTPVGDTTSPDEEALTSAKLGARVQVTGSCCVTGVVVICCVVLPSSTAASVALVSELEVVMESTITSTHNPHSKALSIFMLK